MTTAESKKGKVLIVSFYVPPTNSVAADSDKLSRLSVGLAGMKTGPRALSMASNKNLID